MRRGITLLVLFFAILIGMQNKLQFVQSSDTFIPEEAIRLRILANSDTETDQQLKLKVRDEVLKVIYDKVKNVTDRDEARLIIYDNMDAIEQTVLCVLVENGASTKYTVDYGMAQFPEKTYGNRLYPAGMYESVYIVLGDGEGDNWWCVLFPPLCLVDGTVNTDGTANEDTDVQYSFLIVEWLKDLFGYN